MHKEVKETGGRRKGEEKERKVKGEGGERTKRGEL